MENEKTGKREDAKAPEGINRLDREGDRYPAGV